MTKNQGKGLSGGRRWVRALGVAVAVSLVVPAGVVANAATASAAEGAVTTSAPGLPMAAAVPAKASPRVKGGDKMLTVGWAKKAGATKYIVQVSPKKSFPSTNRKTKTTSGDYAKFTKLTNGKKYYVRVYSVNGSGKKSSRIVSTIPRPYSPGPRITGVKVSAAGSNKIRVTWKAMKFAEKYWIEAAVKSSDLEHAQATSSKRFVKSVPASSTSAVVSIPAKFQKWVGSRTGMPVHLRVYVRNAGAVRKSGIAVGSPTPPTPKGAKLTFATYNVTSIAASASFKGNTWADRRVRVRSAIAYAKADVVAFQEAPFTKYKGVKQYRDVANLMAPYGYALAYSDQTVGSVVMGKQIKESHLLVKTSRVKVLASGLQSTKALSRLIPSSVSDFNFAWAKLQNRSTGKVFYVASVHLQSGDAKSSSVRNTRMGMIQGIQAFMARKAGSAPVVVMGDFNSDSWNDPNGPVTYMVQKGWTNASASKARYNTKYSTTNSYANNGFPAKPYLNELAQVGVRIDQIFTKNVTGTYSYTNQLILKGGYFVKAYQGSDHNLQKAVIAIG